MLSQNNKLKAKKIIKILSEEYGENIKTDLIYETDWQLLIAVILSAQNTDKNVNKITKKLFAKYKNLEEIANLEIQDLEKELYSSGYYKSKSKYISQTAKILVSEYNSKVPNSMEELIKLPGVGRKTANVILGVLYESSEGVVVDTHVSRISYRLGLTRTRYGAEKIEKELHNIIQPKYREKYSLYMIRHGRKYCLARKTKCEICPLNQLCYKRID